MLRRSAMLLLALLAFGQTAWAQGLSGTGTSTDPYLINDSIDWNWFAQSVTDGTTYENQFVSLNDDITVGTMAGIENKCFSGTFDGQGYTITLEMTATMQFTSLFCYADGATFRNLKVDGVLNTSKKFCAGLVGAVVYHGCTFTNCVSDVTINSTVQGDGTHGGFVSYVWDANYFEGCAFTGKLLGPSTTNVGGFVGFTETNQNGSVTFTNCLFIPEEVTMSGNGSQTFARWRSGNSAVTTGANCYYSQTLGAAQGKMMHSITGEANVTVTANGQATTYSMSGISAYSTGIGLTPLTPSPEGEGEMLYAGEGDVVSLNLSCEVPWGYVFEGSYLAEPNATLNGTANPYTLTMSNADVRIVPIYTGYTVSVEANPNIYGAVQVSLDNATWGSSVTTSANDVVYFRFNLPFGYVMNGFFIETEGGVSVGYSDNHFAMPPSNVTVHADFSLDIIAPVTYNVTLLPGMGEGNPIVFIFNPENAAPNIYDADVCQFYYVNDTTIGFWLPGDFCPDSFTEPDGAQFLGWDGWSNNGYITLTSTATTFTAQWAGPVDYIDGNGEMHTCTNYTVLTGGGTTTLAAGWYVVDSDITYNDGIKLYYGDVNLILCNGKTMTVTTAHIPIKGFGHTLTIYGQSLDSIEAGTLNLNCTNNPCITEMTYIQHSGNVTVSSPNNQAGIEASSFTLNGGSLYASARSFGISTKDGGNLIINGGTVTAISTDAGYAGINSNGNIVINGGKVETNKIYAQSNITLGWTNADDYIHAGSYETNAGTISVKSGQSFYYENDEGEQVIVSDTLNTDQINAIAGKMLRPYYIPVNYVDGNGETHTCINYTVLTGGETSLEEGWYVVDSDISYNSTLTLNGDVTLILCNGKTMTVSTSNNCIYGNNHTLTIYGQSLDSIEAGTLNGTNNAKRTIEVATYIQHSGNVTVNSPNHSYAISVQSFTIYGGSLYANGRSIGIYAIGNLTINGGSIHASGRTNGISVNNYGDLTINGGTVIANSTQNNGSNAGLSISGYVVINGGKVEANKIYVDSNIILGWTNADDYILAGEYSNFDSDGIVAVKSGQAFYYENEDMNVVVSGTINNPNSTIAGKTLRPYIEPITVTKDIAGYGTGNGGWHLIASPLLDPINPAWVSNLIADSAAHYDLYRFNPSHEGNEWENYKADSTFRLEAGKGYLYANADDVTLTFGGRPYVGNGRFELVYDSTDERKCWNLVGNPFTCDATLDREYYVMSANGTDINPEPIPGTTPIPPYTAVFVKAVTAWDKAVFTRVTP